MGSLNHYYRTRKPPPQKSKLVYIKWVNRILLLLLVALAVRYCATRSAEPPADPATPPPLASSTAVASSAATKIEPAAKTTVVASSSNSTIDKPPLKDIDLPQRKVDNLTPMVNKINLANQKDTVLAKHIYNLLQQQKPYGAFILLVDAHSNEILAWGQRSDSAIKSEPLWLTRSTFPAASIIKILTAATAMETRRYGMLSEIPIMGKSNTLYLRQLKIPDNYAGPTQNLMQAFALSSNPVMGIIGQHLGGNTLRRHAHHLGFNQTIPFGLRPHSQSVFMPPDTGYAVAECASGFTKDNTISPIHAAAIVRAFLMQKPVALPWSKHISKDLAPPKPYELSRYEFSDNTHYGMRQLFLRTATHGTARKYINKTVYNGNRQRLNIGGKTGSLDGLDPKGRYDWFAGFAQSKDNSGKAVVIVVMQIHDNLRTLPATGVAGVMINHWAKQYLP